MDKSPYERFDYVKHEMKMNNMDSKSYVNSIASNWIIFKDLKQLVIKFR